MKIATGFAVALAALAGGCASESSDYGPSQGYAFPQGYRSTPITLRYRMGIARLTANPTVALGQGLRSL